MYRLSVPVMLHDGFDREGTLAQLRRCGAERVFLAIDTLSFDPKEREHTLALLRENIPFFQAAGLETGVWLWSFLRSRPEADTRGCILQENHRGETFPGAYCPASPGLIADTADFLSKAAAIGPDVIQFDDDYRLLAENENSVACFCPRHLARMQAIAGEPVSRETLYEKGYTGLPNRYRQAVMQATGESMEHFAEEMRRAVDRVNPKIRISVCSCMPTWDTNGTDAVRVAKALAGGTRPLMRLIGAPYWAALNAWGHRLAYVIELSRMESSWCDGSGVEIMSEGDTHPRPRYRVAANYLAHYDTALRFSGETDGILKYMMDYVSSPGYETGYVNRHVRNQPEYDAIAAMTAGTAPEGVRVYETMAKMAQADLTDIPDPAAYSWNSFFSKAARMMADSSVPTVYRGTGWCGIAFGENARHLPPDALDHGLILDVRAARILTEQGVDVGLTAVGGRFKAERIRYPAEGEETVSGYGSRSVYDVTLRPGAEILAVSTRRTVAGDETGWDGTAVGADETEYPDVIHYVNQKGQKFLVLAFDADFTDALRWRTYAMQRLLLTQIGWLFGRTLPVSCPGHPDLYLQYRTGGGAAVLGLWNQFPDDIPAPTVLLDRPYRRVVCYGCTGTLSGAALTLSDLAPYGRAYCRLEP